MATMLTSEMTFTDGSDYQLIDGKDLSLELDGADVTVNGNILLEYDVYDPKMFQFSVSVSSKGIVILCDGDGVIRHAFEAVATDQGVRFHPIADHVAVARCR